MTGEADEVKYRALFLEEAQDLLEGALSSLFELESNPGDRAAVDEFFRVVHTIKGMAGALGYGSMGEFCHEAEAILDCWRCGEGDVCRDDLELGFHIESALRAMTMRPDDDASHRDALAQLRAASTSRTPDVSVAEGRPEADVSFPPPGPGESGVVVFLDESVTYPRLRFKMVLGRLAGHGEVLRSVPPAEEWDRLGSGSGVAFYLAGDVAESRALESVTGVGEIACAAFLRPEVTVGTEGAGVRLPAGSGGDGLAMPLGYRQTGIRVDRRHLDRITNMVGETLLVRRRLSEVLADHPDPTVRHLLESLDDTVHGLEHEVLAARMVPVGTIFQRFHRLVRELGQKLGKQVGVEFVGGDTEIDRYLLEKISEPLVHIIRNALDHGIEPADERVAAGKPREGRLVVTAALEHGNVAVKVEDDGRGIDAASVLESARRTKRLEAGADDLSRAQIFALLFEPGFSTAKEVTDVSGRGVGLDVVRRKVVEVGGDINLLSEAGQGTKVVMEFPPTLSLLRTLLVRASRCTLGIARNQVYRIEWLDPTAISWVKGIPLTLVDDRPVVVRSLRALLAGEDPYQLEGCAWLVLVKLSSRVEAMAVEELVGEQELVVRPLTKTLGTAPGIVGTSVLSEEELALYVDLRMLMVARNEAAEFAVR